LILRHSLPLFEGKEDEDISRRF